MLLAMPVGLQEIPSFVTSPDHVAAPKYTPLTRQLKNVSIKDVEEWERKIMEDPKVR